MRLRVRVTCLDPIIGDTGETAYAEALLDYLTGKTEAMTVVSNRSHMAFSTLVGGALVMVVAAALTQTRIDPHGAIVGMVVFAGTIYPLYMRYGVLGVAWAVSLYGCLSVYAAYLCFALCDLSLRRLSSSVWQVATATLLGAAVVWPTAHSWLGAQPLLGLFVGALAGLAVTLGALMWLDRHDAAGYRRELSQALRALRGRRA